MIFRYIYGILPPEFRKKGIQVAATVPIRAILDLVGIAVLIPVLLLVLDADQIPPDTLLGKLKNWSNIESSQTFALIVCCFVLLIICIKSSLTIAISAFQNRYLLSLYRYFSHLLFKRLYQRGLLFIKEKNSAELSHSINYVCYSFATRLLSPIFLIAGEGILLLFIFIALLVYNPQITLLIPLCFLPAIWLYTKFVRQRIRTLGKAENKAKQRQSRLVQEAFRGYAELEVNHAFPYIEEQFNQELENISSGRKKLEVILRIPGSLMEIGVVIGMILLIVMSQGGESLQISFTVFAMAALRMLPAVRTLINSWTQIHNHLYCVDLIKEGLANPAEEVAEQTPIPFNRTVEIRNLSFSFSDAPLISNLSFTIHKGERLGIRGASGVGKSTLFNLLLGFYPPSSGSIFVDDHQLTLQERPSWLSHVGYVPQEVFILDNTLAANIALGVPTDRIDRKKVQQVLEQVKLGDLVATLPSGIDTHLGESGCRLSGGQRQRVGIARALYKSCDLLFFDEATSSLDNQTEREINNAIQELSETHQELTLIIIAHRESSLAFCDRIIELHS